MTIGLTMFMLLSCTDFEVPNHVVVEHVKQIINKEIGNGFDINITLSSPGEGDFDTVYQYTEFNMIAMYDQRIKLPKSTEQRNIIKGQKLIGGRIVIFYQRNNSDWKLIRYWINEIPH